MKKALVLGASGAMGRYVVPFLAEKGYAVDAVSLDAPDPSADPAGVTRIQGNGVVASNPQRKAANCAISRRRFYI